MKALFLSPHLDDAVFSCGGTMAKFAARGDTVILATVFAGSVQSPRGFALACQLDKGLSPDVNYTQTGFQFGGRLREALTELAAREGSSGGVPWAERMLERQ